MGKNSLSIINTISLSQLEYAIEKIFEKYRYNDSDILLLSTDKVVLKSITKLENNLKILMKSKKNITVRKLINVKFKVKILIKSESDNS